MNPHYATFDTFSIGSAPFGTAPFGPPDEPVVAPTAENRTAAARTRVPVLARIAELESPSTASLAVSVQPTAAPSSTAVAIEPERKLEPPRRPELRRDPAESKFRATPIVQPAPAPIKPITRTGAG